MLCERYACINDAEYLVDYVERATGKSAFQKKMCSRHKKATYLCYRIERIEVMNEEEKEMIKKCCYGCEKNDAVCDLIFGELAELYRIPWCQHCVCPDTWNASPFHHAESYNTGNKYPQCTKCGEVGRNVWKGKGYCRPCFDEVSGTNKKKEISIEKCEVTGCHFNARPYDNLCEEHAERVAKSLEKDASALNAMAEAAQKVITGISDVLKENFIPSSVGPLSTEHLVPTKEQLEYAATKRAELKKEIDAPLYNRQPHYEGGIDPITFGQDNLSPSEMNGFYKMNVIKYVARCDRKNGLEDLKKAQDYLNLLIGSYEKRGIEQHDEKDVHAERPFKDVIYDLLHNGSLTLKRQSINYWGDAIDAYLDKHNHDYSIDESVDFITYTIERA